MDHAGRARFASAKLRRRAHSPASAPQGNKESGWDPRMVLVIGGVALAIVALLGFWIGRL